MHVYVGDDGNDGFSSRQGGQEKPERVIFEEKPEEGQDARTMRLSRRQHVQRKALR